MRWNPFKHLINDEQAAIVGALAMLVAIMGAGLGYFVVRDFNRNIEPTQKVETQQNQQKY